MRVRERETARQKGKEIERGLVEREKETGVSGWETHMVSRSTSIEQRDSRIQRDHVERGWERWKNTKQMKRENEREGSYILPLGRWESSKELARERGKRENVLCIRMRLHTCVYVCVYIYIYISMRLRVNRLSTVSHIEHKLMVHLLLVS